MKYGKCRQNRWNDGICKSRIQRLRNTDKISMPRSTQAIRNCRFFRKSIMVYNYIQRFRFCFADYSASSCVIPHISAYAGFKVISFTRFKSENMLTRANLVTPVRNTNFKYASDDFKTPYSSRLPSNIASRVEHSRDLPKRRGDGTEKTPRRNRLSVRKSGRSYRYNSNRFRGFSRNLVCIRVIF